MAFVVRRVPPRRFGPGLAVATLVLLAGCGGGASPVEAVPALSDRLTAVDDAVAAGDDAATRAALDDLVRVTRQAEGAGELDASDADDILAAAGQLEELLPEEVEPEPTPEGSVTETPAPEEDSDSEGGGDEEGPGHGHGHGKGKAKGHG